MDRKMAAFKKRYKLQTDNLKCSWLRDFSYTDLYSIVLEYDSVFLGQPDYFDIFLILGTKILPRNSEQLLLGQSTYHENSVQSNVLPLRYY